MSLEAMVWALKHAPVKDPHEHLVLLGLADHAGADGTGAWPTVATLATYARCSSRTVQNRLRSLEDAGLIVRGDQRMVAHRPANRRPVVYNLALGVRDVRPTSGVNEAHPKADAGVNEDASRGERPGALGVNAVADKPSLNLPEPSITPSPRPAATPSAVPTDELIEYGFAAFWEAYPRKVGKQAARKAFVSAVRRIAKETRQTVDLGAIVNGARRMAADPNLPDEAFIPHAATWLNQGRWDDPPYPPRTDRRPTTDDRVRDGLDVARRLAEQEGAPRAIGGAW